MIICSIEPEYVPMIVDQKDPREVWKKLPDATKSRCTASVHTLRNRLFNLRMSAGMMIWESVNEICTIQRQLLFAGKVVDGSDKTFVLLNGIRSKYAVKKTILQEKYDKSFEKMVSSLELTDDELNDGDKPNSS